MCEATHQLSRLKYLTSKDNSSNLLNSTMLHWRASSESCLVNHSFCHWLASPPNQNVLSIFCHWLASPPTKTYFCHWLASPPTKTYFQLATPLARVFILVPLIHPLTRFGRLAPGRFLFRQLPILI